MPPRKRSALGRSSTVAKRLRISRQAETPDLREQRLSQLRDHASTSRAIETTEEREERLRQLRDHASTSRAIETTEEREERLRQLRDYASTSRASETTEEREQRLEQSRERNSASRANEPADVQVTRLLNQRVRQRQVRNVKWAGKKNSAFEYNCAINYESDSVVSIGNMSVICQFCSAKKWKSETPGLCCAAGKVHLEPLQPLPELLHALMVGDHPASNHFLKFIRCYNSAFQMTSFGGKVVSENGYMPTFKVQGQVYHRIGSLLPELENAPQFLQLYFMGDSEEEAQMRCNLNQNLRPEIVSGIQELLHELNGYIRDFKIALESNQNAPDLRVIIHADRKPAGEHAGRYNAPVTNEVAVVLVDQQIGQKRDIVLTKRSGAIKRIAETHRAYDCMQYPLMFCRGEDGYNFNIPMVKPDTREPATKKVSCMNFYAYRIMDKVNHTNHLLYFRSLLNQFLVDMYAKAETERLNYIRFNQKQLRADEYIHLQDAVERDGDLENIGQLVILPSSFTAGPRYMHQKLQDAMTYVRTYGRPDLFITFTCNPKWKEIADALFAGQKPEDRHDLISRIFHLKVKKMMDLLTKRELFGSVLCFMYSIEWQKRGLPHVHILVWLETRIMPDDVDKFICAEIPNKDEDPKLFEIVRKSMIHGPCGAINGTSVCMVNGKCNKKFPKKFVTETQTGNDGYPLYRRRRPEDGGQSFTMKLRNGADYDVDNQWVVPYCPVLSRIFESHINVEYCHSVKSIKYICKYVNKGSDMATFQVDGGSDGNANVVNNGTAVNNSDEVRLFQTGRYICSSEAAWRLFSFPIHEHHPAVYSLQVHLENGQRVYFQPHQDIEEVLARPARSTLLAFFELCESDPFAKTLVYPQVPQYYTLSATKKFSRRKQGKAVEGYPGVFKADTLGRVYTVHPNNAECYFLRMLLHVVPGPTSFDYLKTVDGELCQTFQLACQRLGLLEDDDHWNKALQEAAVSEAPKRLRYLFALMLQLCHVADPRSLWEQNKENMAEDILRRHRVANNNSQLQYNDEIYNETLVSLQEMVLSLGPYKQLSEFGLPQPVSIQPIRRLVYDIFDVDQMRQYVDENEPKLTPEQRTVYDEIMTSVDGHLGKSFFLDAPGGTGKTFLINLILSKMRSTQKIVFAVASCGIAATLLQGGKTAHSTFKLPLNLHHQDEPVCSLKRGSDMAKLLQECALIVWDECTMSNRAAVEAVNRTLQDLTGKKCLMGGITVLFSGDFRQTLPVVVKGHRADEVKACLKSSRIWSSIRRLNLRTNMRVHLHGNDGAEEFSQLLLDIGDGKLQHRGDNEINLPIGLGKIVANLNQLISCVYPQLQNLEEKSSDWFCERAILSTKNETVAAINDRLLEGCDGETVTYKSIDTTVNRDDAVHYPTEFLNSLDLPGLPPHKLKLKLHAPIMLLRNLAAPRLCNGTRLRIIRLRPNIIEAEILTGCAKGEIEFIPRIPMIPQDCPYEFKRLQFPIKLSFGMTINKAQGQTLKFAGIDLRTPCFSHGQLYVACSRVGSADGLCLLAPGGKTTNVVYPEVFRI